MTVQIRVTIEVDEELADSDHASGLTEEGHETLMDSIMSVGVVVAGPERV